MSDFQRDFKSIIGIYRYFQKKKAFEPDLLRPFSVLNQAEAAIVPLFKIRKEIVDFVKPYKAWIYYLGKDLASFVRGIGSIIQGLGLFLSLPLYCILGLVLVYQNHQNIRKETRFGLSDFLPHLFLQIVSGFLRIMQGLFLLVETPFVLCKIPIRSFLTWHFGQKRIEDLPSVIQIANTWAEKSLKEQTTRGSSADFAMLNMHRKFLKWQSRGVKTDLAVRADTFYQTRSAMAYFCLFSDKYEPNVQIGIRPKSAFSSRRGRYHIKKMH